VHERRRFPPRDFGLTTGAATPPCPPARGATAQSAAAVFAWALSVGAALRRSQAKTLAALVAAAIRRGRGRLAGLGRRLKGPALCKHKVKRVWRSAANTRVAVADGMAGVLARLGRRTRPPPAALGWVEARAFHTPMAAAVLGGRAVPLLWASYPEWQLFESHNDLEEGLPRLPKALLPPGLRVVILADRGSGRAELARACSAIGLHFLPRIKPDAGVRPARYRGLLYGYPVKKGVHRVPRQAAYRLTDPVTVGVVIRRKKGPPPERDECWFLTTDLPGTAVQLTEPRARRVAVEGPSRDDESPRNGRAQRLTQLTKAARFDRLLVVLALAYWLLVGRGPGARRHFPPSRWCPGNDPGRCSAFTAGRVRAERMTQPPSLAFTTVAHAIGEAAAKWG
jgi:hypothetical protein